MDKKEEKTSMTVREVLKSARVQQVSFMTGSGYVRLKKEEFQQVLDGELVWAHLGERGTEHKINPSEFLELEVIDPYIQDGILYAVV